MHSKNRNKVLIDLTTLDKNFSVPKVLTKEEEIKLLLSLYDNDVKHQEMKAEVLSLNVSKKLTGKSIKRCVGITIGKRLFDDTSSSPLVCDKSKGMVERN